MHISRVLSMCSSLLCVTLPCALLSSWPFQALSIISSTQVTARLHLGSPSQNHDLRTLSGCQVGQSEFTSFFLHFAGIIINHILISNILKIIVLYILHDFVLFHIGRYIPSLLVDDSLKKKIPITMVLFFKKPFLYKVFPMYKPLFPNMYI